MIIDNRPIGIDVIYRTTVPTGTAHGLYMIYITDLIYFRAYVKKGKETSHKHPTLSPRKISTLFIS